jgi:CheY-like chemotaxis protein
VENKKVLVVDDDEDIRTALRILCEEFGHTVHEASTVEETMRMVTDNPDLDAIIMDGFLGAMQTGPTLDLIRRIRPLVKGKIIAHTSLKSFVPQMRQAGCDHAVVKGKLQELTKLIGGK